MGEIYNLPTVRFFSFSGTRTAYPRHSTYEYCVSMDAAYRKRCLLAVSPMTAHPLGSNPKPQKLAPGVGFPMINVFEVISVPVRRRHAFYISNCGTRRVAQKASIISRGCGPFNSSKLRKTRQRWNLAKIGVTKANDNNFKTVRGRTKLHTRHNRKPILGCRLLMSQLTSDAT